MNMDSGALIVARVTRVGGMVVNIEMATQEWIDEHQDDPWFIFPISPDKDGTEATIGLRYDEQTGLFEKRPVSDE